MKNLALELLHPFKLRSESVNVCAIAICNFVEVPDLLAVSSFDTNCPFGVIGIPFDPFDGGVEPDVWIQFKMASI